MSKFCAYCDIKILEEDRSCQGCGAPVRKTKERKSLDVRGGKGQFITAIADAWDVEPRDLFDVSKSARASKWHDDATAIAIVGGDFQLKKGSKTNDIHVKAIHSDTSVSTPPPMEIFWETTDKDILLIKNGELIAKKKGKAFLWAKVWGKKGLDACVEVTIK